MGITASVLDDILRTIAPGDDTLDAVQNRRDEVLGLVAPYPGALRTYASGSIAHRTANDDTDADGGVVLNQRWYHELGPDGDDEGPIDMVENMRAYLRDALKDAHPRIAFRLSKRAIRVTYKEPLADETDPTVDLIVALTRKDGALWIPNLDRPGWDPSDPECHARLMTADPATLRRTRAKIVRLAKAWNRQYTQPGLSAFNITALALACITEGMGVATGLAELFTYAAKDLKQRLTPDPANVSPPIKVLIDRNSVVLRLEQASQRMEEALAHDDDEMAVREALSSIYWEYPECVQPPAGSTSKAAFANILRSGNSGVSISGGLIMATPNAHPLKTTRAYGSGPVKGQSDQ
jgi:hypothetical protein